MSSLLRRMQRRRNGMGKFLGITYPQAKDLIARQRREAKRKGESTSEPNTPKVSSLS